MVRGASTVYATLFILFGILYPVFCTMLAIETKSTKDDIVWLMYWIIFGLFNVVEYFADFIFGWFPLYSLLKILFIIWSVAPLPALHENGAYYLYKVFVQPFFRFYRGHVDCIITEAMERTVDVVQYMPAYAM